MPTTGAETIHRQEHPLPPQIPKVLSPVLRSRPDNRAMLIYFRILLVVWLALASGITPTSPWQSPLDQELVIARAFDPPAKDWQRGHRGVDLDVAVGTTVKAPAAGIVVYAGTLVDRGVVSLEHANGIRSTYEAVSPLVKQGEPVSQGQPIAVVTAGHSPGALHWGARVGKTTYLDPLSLLGRSMILKPWP